MLKDQIVNAIISGMAPKLSPDQLTELMNVLTVTLHEVDIVATNNALSTDMQNNHKMINAFISCKRLDGLAPSSERAYLYCLRNFLDYTNNLPFNKVETNTIRYYLIMLEHRGCAKSTVDNNRRYLRLFFEWLTAEDYILRNPAKKIGRIKEPFRLKRFFNEYEMESLRDACMSKRDIALTDLLLSTGMRIGEIPNIKLSDINSEEGSIKIIGKGDKERIVYLNVRAKKHLKEYLDERKASGIDSDYLICREKWNKKYEKKPLTKESIGKIVKKIGERCKVEDIHIHGIRAYFATNLSDKGVSPAIIQELMGHESYATTVRYYCNQNKANAKNAVLAHS